MLVTEIVSEDANILDIQRNIELYKLPYHAAQLVRGAKTFNKIIDSVYNNPKIAEKDRNRAVENEIEKISGSMMGGVSVEQYYRLLQIANAEYGMNTALPKINIMKNVLNKLTNTFDIDGQQLRIG
jgi:hypothetical protein